MSGVNPVVGGVIGSVGTGLSGFSAIMKSSIEYSKGNNYGAGVTIASEVVFGKLGELDVSKVGFQQQLYEFSVEATQEATSQ